MHMEEIFVSHWKSLEELKTYLPMSSTLFSPNFSVHLRSYTKCQCYPESWARYIHTQFEENQVSTSTTTQQNVFTFQQIQPQAIFAEAHIDKFEGCTFNIIVLIFCGDQSKISRPKENWLLSDRGTNRHYLHCGCTFGHFSYIVVSTTSFFIEPVWKILSSFIDEVCAKVGLWTVMYRSNRNFNISPPPLTGIWHLCHPGRREFDYQSPPGGGEFELHPQFHVKSVAWGAVVGDVVLEDFHGKDCAFEANWLRVLCRIWRYLNLIFLILDSGFE